ncbi:MAG: AzlD domain-containing protein, partial [Pseudomonadota bacterium]|nr:AzlD domain-containing protein [Pseudomonadota bacterium]
MTLDPASVATILGMAVVTYATRIAGFLLTRRLALAGTWTLVLEAVPPAVLAAVIAPAVLTR